MSTYISPNARIVKALDGIIEVTHASYSGDADTFAVFKTTSRRKRTFASGFNHSVEALIYLDVFTPNDPSAKESIIGKIDEALSNAGFVVMNIADVERDEWSGRWHTEFSLRWEEEKGSD